MITLEIAQQLVDTLSKHPGIIPIDKNKFVELLMSIKLTPTSKFHIEILDNDKNKQLFQESSSRYYYLSIRRILINKNVANCNFSLIKKIWSSLISNICWSSSVFSRRLRLDKEISNIINGSECEFSLLAKLETYDFGNSERNLFIVSRPVLVIAGLEEKDIDVIAKWEEVNTVFERETGFFFRHNKRISHKEYLVSL